MQDTHSLRLLITIHHIEMVTSDYYIRFISNYTKELKTAKVY